MSGTSGFEDTVAEPQVSRVHACMRACVGLACVALACVQTTPTLTMLLLGSLGFKQPPMARCAPHAVALGAGAEAAYANMHIDQAHFWIN